MTAGKKQKAEKESTAEQITAEESLKRMKSFLKRKENFIGAAKKSKN